MWWLANPQDLHRVSDRLSSIYVDRCHIDRDDNAVVLVNRERTIRVPAAMVATPLLGPETRITNAAVRLLADSGTAICWVGEYGVRFYACGTQPQRQTPPPPDAFRGLPRSDFAGRQALELPAFRVAVA
jgi:CRISPR-associated protein Cas1